LCLSAGIACCRAGNTEASHEKNRQNEATNPNCIRVRVAGFGKAFRMDFEEVFVRALDIYQTIQRIFDLSALK
jgi:hypothetical protein